MPTKLDVLWLKVGPFGCGVDHHSGQLSEDRSARSFPHRTGSPEMPILGHPVTRSLDPTGTGQKRWIMRWKPALNAFAITFADRIPASENN